MKNNLNIGIAEPCSADWNKMTPDKNGRHCSFCNKTVVDFSKMSVDEIKCYFNDNAGKSTCGHFYSNQLENNHTLYQDNILARYRKANQNIKNKFLKAAALFCLGLMLSLSGCNSHKEEEMVDGGISPHIDTTYHPNDTLKTH
jgi:hypothetical protein